MSIVTFRDTIIVPKSISHLFCHYELFYKTMSTASNFSDNESNFSDLDQFENQEESINAISETIAGLLEQVRICLLFFESKVFFLKYFIFLFFFS